MLGVDVVRAMRSSDRLQPSRPDVQPKRLDMAPERRAALSSFTNFGAAIATIVAGSR